MDNHVEEFIEFKERCKSNTKRLDEHDEQIKELRNVYVALTKVDDKVTNVEKDVVEMKNDLKEIKEKPLKDYEETKKEIKKNIISFVSGVILTAITIGLGFKFLL